MKLSALVCAHNDEARLADCLRRLEFCDEIVLVADRCTDRTQEIARQAGARVIDGIFPLESQRRAAGLEATQGEWILEVEPDESVDATLAYEVRAAIHGRPGGDWFDVPVDNYVAGTLVRRGWGGGFGASSAPRLYRRHVKSWLPGRIGAQAVMDGRHAGAIETPLRRQAEHDFGAMIARLDRQSALRAQDIADAGRAYGMMTGVGRGLRGFFSSFVLRQGLREGDIGLMIGLMSGLEPILSGLRARELIRSRAIAAQAAHAEAAQPTPIGRSA